MIGTYYKLHRDQMTDLIRDQISELQDVLSLLENDDSIKVQAHRASFLRMQKVQGSLRFLRNKLTQRKLNKELYESKAA
jgi:hypothetical protein